jgi:hypothetical protein
VAAIRVYADTESEWYGIVLCRMLFQDPGEGYLRRPRLGGAVFTGGTSYADWPREPIALVDGVPILVVRGYMLAGQAEPLEAYLDYCLANGRWVTERYAQKSRADIRAAIEQLIAAGHWPRPLREDELAFLRGQVE